jgi:pimeloyl-ACP methyl ester carboxylesterase
MAAFIKKQDDQELRLRTMKAKYRLLTGTAMALLMAGVTGGAITYKGWRKTELQRLQEGSKIMETPFGPVEYHRHGTGPAILIIHGSPGGYDLGVALQKLIGMPEFTYLSISRPGYLRTPLSTGKTPEEQADLYAYLLDTLSIPQATLIGISGGGPSSIQFALRHPERCQGLVLISAVARHYSEHALKQHLSPLGHTLRDIYEKLTISDPFLFFILKLARLPLPGVNAQTFDMIRTATLYERRQVGYENDMIQFEAITSYPLEKIMAPTFVTHGTSDQEVTFENAELLAQKVPQVQLQIIPGGTHIAFFTHTSLVMPNLRLFLRETSHV